MAYWWFDPYGEFEKMRKRMRQAMTGFALPISEEFLESSFPVDVIDADEELIVKADLPGFDKDEILVKVTDNSIWIAAQHKEEKREKGEREGMRYFRAERSFGALKRVLALPVEVDADKVVAKFDKSTLELRMKKKKSEKKAKEVRIE